MNESMKITVNEWAEDNNIKLNDEQIKDLIYGIEMCREIEMYNTGFSLGYTKTEKDTEIEKLKNTIDLLEKFISFKGYRISYGDNYVTEFTMENNGLFNSSDRKTTFF